MNLDAHAIYWGGALVIFLVSLKVRPASFSRAPFLFSLAAALLWPLELVLFVIYLVIGMVSNTPVGELMVASALME